MMRDALTVTEKWGHPTRKLNPSPRRKVHGKQIQEGSEEEQQKEKNTKQHLPKKHAAHIESTIDRVRYPAYPPSPPTVVLCCVFVLVMSR